MTVGTQIAPEIVLTMANQQCYEKFQKMNPLQFQSDKSEDTHEFLTLCMRCLRQ